MKKYKHLAIILAALSIQTAALIFFIWRYERVLTNGTEVRIKCQAYDPYDPFRGRYLQASVNERCTNLLFDTENCDVRYSTRPEDFFVKLVEIPGSNSFYQVEAVAREMHKDGIWVTPSYIGFRENSDSKNFHAIIRFPNQLFVNEHIAKKGDQILSKNSSSAAAVYRVYNGKMILTDIEIGGKSIRELAKEAKD